MPPKSKTTLTDSQKYELCLYARDNKKSRAEYVNWIENKWQVRVNESTITRILQRSNQLLSEEEIIAPNAKRHRSVTYPELEQALREFVLMRQHQIVLSDTILIERAKTLANGLGIPEGALNFSVGWLQKFKSRNNIHQIKLQGEGASVNLNVVVEALPQLHEICINYPPERIYNMDETGLFYR